jgi:hypothetical protein
METNVAYNTTTDRHEPHWPSTTELQSSLLKTVICTAQADAGPAKGAAGLGVGSSVDGAAAGVAGAEAEGASASCAASCAAAGAAGEREARKGVLADCSVGLAPLPAAALGRLDGDLPKRWRTVGERVVAVNGGHEVLSIFLSL